MRYRKKGFSFIALLVVLLFTTTLFSYKDVHASGESIWVDGYSAVVNDDDETATITGYSGKETDLTIPSEIEGYRVTSIGGLSFHFDLTSISIPDSVTNIEKDAFWCCDDLTTITIPDSVTSIGEGAFSNCRSLTSITIPNGVTRIEERTFYECSNLTSIVIPDSVVSIGESAFYECSNLTSIVIPDSVVSIGRSAFKRCSNLTSIVIPDGVIWIGERAFEECSSLTTINIPNGVTRIEKDTFFCCSNLTSITIPDSVTNIEEYAFWECSSLTTITIPNGVVEIGSSAFKECSSLTTINIPNGVTRIEEDTFWRCNNLTSITIPDSITYIGEFAFYGCSSLEIFALPNGVKKIGGGAFENTGIKELYFENRLLRYNGDSEEYLIRMGTEIIDEGAFTGNNRIQQVIIPNSVTEIKNRAFSGCSSLTTITIPNTVTSIGGHAFSGCSSLTAITIPDSVTSIEEETFFCCSSLTAITIPDSVTSIKGGAFWYCSSLTTITIPDGVTGINDYVFMGCRSLTSIVIPDGVIWIGESAFKDCRSLISITIPDSVTIIGEEAFSSCSNLTSIAIPNGVTRIEDYTFKGCSSLTAITIPESVIYIGWGAFYDCSSLIDISIPNGVGEIVRPATFSGCSSLTTITIPDSVTFICDDVFERCNSLQSIKGRKGSYAEKYANKNSIPFIEIGTFGISTHPQSQLLASGNVNFSVTAEGEGLTYQWYWRKNPDANWAIAGFTGSKTATMTVEAIPARNGYQYRCEVKDSLGNTIYSNPATLTVYTPIVIAKQPINTSAVDGDGNVKFTVVATGSGLTYQWFWRKNSSASWASYTTAGATNTEMTVGAISARNGFQYRCTIKDTNGTVVYSNIATLTVTAKPVTISITKQPVSVTANDGSGNVKFSVAATGSGLSYQWFWRRNESTSWAAYTSASATNTEMTVGAISARNGFQYRCMIKDANGIVAYSNVATLTVTAKPENINIIVQPASVTKVDGSGDAKFSVVAVGSGLTYQWYWRKDSSSAWAVSGSTGAKTATLTIGAISARNGFQYYCEIKDSTGGVVKTNTVVLTVNPALAITKQPVNVTAKDGSGNVKFSVAASGTGLTYQWFWRKTSSSAWTAYNSTASAANTEISVGAISARNGFQYYCVVKDSTGKTVSSNVATLTVTSSLSITKQPVNVTAANGSGNVKFSVAASGSGLTYQWYWRKNANSAWATYGTAGANNTELTIGAITARNGYQYYCLVKDSSGRTVSSNIATLKIVESPTILKQPANVTAKNGGSTVKFNVEVAGVGVTYQWYWRKNSSSSWAVNGSTGCKTATLSIDPITARNGFQYFCVITDASGNVTTTNIATLTVTQ